MNSQDKLDLVRYRLLKAKKHFSQKLRCLSKINYGIML